MAEAKKENENKSTKKSTSTNAKKSSTTKKTVAKKETVKEEKVVLEDVKEEPKENAKKSEFKKETMMGIGRNAELVLVYIFSILGLIFSIMKDENINEDMKFHYNQAATIWIVSMFISIVSNIVSHITFIASIIFIPISLILFIFTVIALVKACNGEKYEVPVINDLSKSIWK